MTRGWEDLPLDIIEPRIDEELRRERLSSNEDTISDSSSTVSGFQYPRGPLGSGSRRKLHKKVRFDLGPDILSFHGSGLLDDVHYIDVPHDEDDIPMHSLKISSPGRGCGTKITNGKFRQEGDLPLPLANRTGRSQMHPSSMMTTLGLGGHTVSNGRLCQLSAQPSSECMMTSS